MDVRQKRQELIEGLVVATRQDKVDWEPYANFEKTYCVTLGEGLIVLSRNMITLRPKDDGVVLFKYVPEPLDKNSDVLKEMWERVHMSCNSGETILDSVFSELARL
jgi:hypothetical protein